MRTSISSRRQFLFVVVLFTVIARLPLRIETDSIVRSVGCADHGPVKPAFGYRVDYRGTPSPRLGTRDRQRI